MKIEYYNPETYNFLLQVMSYYKGVTHKGVISKSKKRPLPEIRAVFVVLAVEKFCPRISKTQIEGQINRDHSNYKHHNDMVADYYKFDKEFRKLFDKIKIDIMSDMMDTILFVSDDIH